MNYNIRSNVFLILLGIQSACCFLLDTGTIGKHRDGWSDWSCQQQGEFCFKSRTCNSTDDFTCSKTSEVTVTNCPCVADTGTFSEHRDGWSDWSCQQQGDLCFKSRTCNSTDDFNCSKSSEVTVTNCPCVADTDTISEQKGGWSDWSCKKQGEFCFKSRTCNSTADFDCTKTSEVTVTNCPCVAEWSLWGGWTCHTDKGVCLQMRKRTCISGFKGNDCLNLQGKYYEQLFCGESCNDTDTISENRDGWSDWRCTKQGDFCFISRTCTSTADFNCSKTSEVIVTNCPCAAEWSLWGGWTCHTDQNVCLKLRKRTCISGYKGNDCLNLQGKYYEQTFCDESCNDNASISGYRDGWSDWSCEKQGGFCFKSRTCNSTADFNCSNTSEVTVINCPCIAEWSPWGEWTCQIDHGVCLQLRQRTCISGFKDNDCLTLQGEHFEETLCDGSCNATLTTEPLSTSKPLGATTTSGVHWLEWSDWECKTAHRICLMSRTRNCSTHIVDDCEIKLGGVYFNTELCRAEICTVNWSEWSSWTCRIEKDGSCNKTRSRKCSTGSDVQCGFESLERKPCDDVTCPELNALGQLGYCKGLDSSSCLDADTCKNPSIRLMCLADSHVASKICPKACGCCHVDPEWSSWSDWRCERTKTMCRMKQSRTCSTGNTTDCEGISVREAVCDESLCPEQTWDSWSDWKCQLRPNNTCIMSRSRTCSDGDFCIGESHEDDVCSSEMCPDFVGFKVDCSLHNTKSDACADGAGCHYFKNTPKTLCVDNAEACPVTCGCCIPHISPGGTKTPNPYGFSGNGSNGTGSEVTTNIPFAGNGSNGTGSGVATNNTIVITTQNPSGSGGNGSNGTGSGFITNNPIVVTTQNPSGSGGHSSNGTDSGVTTNNPIVVITQNPSESGGNGSNGTGSGIKTNNPIGVTTQNPSGFDGNGSNETGSGITTNNPIGLTTQNPSGSGGNGSNGTNSGVTTNNPIVMTSQNPSGFVGTSSGVTTNNPIGATTQKPSGSGGNGSNGTGSGVTTSNPIGGTTHNPSGNGSNGTGSAVTTNNSIGVTTQNPSGFVGTSSGVTTNNPIGATTQKPSGSSGNGSNGTGSGVTTNNPIGMITQNPSGSGGSGSNGTDSGVTSNNPIGVTTQNPSGSGGYSSSEPSSGVTTNNPIGVTTQNPSGSGGNGSNGTGSGITTNNPIGVTTKNPSGSDGNGSNGTGSGITTNNPIGVTTQNPSGCGGNGSNGTGSGVSTNYQTGVTTQNPSGSWGNKSNGTGYGVTTNNPIGVTTQNPSGSSGNSSNGTSYGGTTNYPIGVTTHNPSGSGANGLNGTGSGVSTNNPVGVTTQTPSGSGGYSSNETSSGVTTNNPIAVTTHNPSGSGGNVSNGTGSRVTTNNFIGVTTQNRFGFGGNSSNGTSSGVTTNKSIGVTTHSQSGSGGNGSNGTGSRVSTNNQIGVTAQNPSGSGKNGSNGTGSGVTTNNPIGVTIQNTSGSVGNSSNGKGSVVTTNHQLGVSTQSPPVSGGKGTIGTGSINVTNSTSHTVAQIPAPIITSPLTTKTTTTTQTQPHTDSLTAGTSITTHVASPATTAPTTATTQAVTTASTEATTATAATQNLPHTSPPVPVTCNVCSGPEFLCEKLFAPQTCSPPNNYCINKLSNHRDGTRLVTRSCGNFDTCYRDWFIASSDSDRCRIFDENSVITLEFDCTYCCTSDNCNKPIKPLAKDLYKNIE